MALNEKEKEVIWCLRNPLYRAHQIMQGVHSPVADLSNEELLSLYNKMDVVIEEEGDTRRSLGEFDEMYILDLAGVKNSLLKEIKKRGLYKSITKKENDATVDGKEKSGQLKDAGLACRLLNPLLDVTFPEEMQDKLTVFRKPEISKCIAFDSVEDIKTNR